MKRFKSNFKLKKTPSVFELIGGKKVAKQIIAKLFLKLKETKYYTHFEKFEVLIQIRILTRIFEFCLG